MCQSVVQNSVRRRVVQDFLGYIIRLQACSGFVE